MDIYRVAIIFIVLFAVFAWFYERKSRQKRRLRFIQNYKIPKPIIDRFREKYPKLSSDEVLLVNKALMDYFYLCNVANGKMVSMPSRVADDLWHEFLLFSSVYEKFCKKAFGRFLHHIPDEAMPNKNSNNEGMRRAWQLICQKEHMNPKFPTRLPLLFAIDSMLNIDNGIKYSLNKMDSYSSNNSGVGCSGNAGCGAGCGGFYVGDYADSSVFGDSGGGLGDSGGASCGGASCGGGCGGA